MPDRRRCRWLPLAVCLAALPTAAMADDFVCRGRDPGWELVGRGNQAVLTPEKGARRTFSGGASNLPAEGVVVWRGRAADSQPDAVAVMLKGACTDPGAGETSGYLGILSLPSAAPAVGCCNYGGRSAAGPALAAVEPEPNDRRRLDGQQAKTAKPAPAEAPAATSKPARSLAPGATARVAGSPKQKVNLRAKPAENARVLGKVAGGRVVVIQEASSRDGAAWYRIKGKGVPANAWIRADLLAGG